MSLMNESSTRYQIQSCRCALLLIMVNAEEFTGHVNAEEFIGHVSCRIYQYRLMAGYRRGLARIPGQQGFSQKTQSTWLHLVLLLGHHRLHE